jgi:hypothetical protein
MTLYVIGSFFPAQAARDRVKFICIYANFILFFKGHGLLTLSPTAVGPFGHTPL